MKIADNGADSTETDSTENPSLVKNFLTNDPADPVLSSATANQPKEKGSPRKVARVITFVGRDLDPGLPEKLKKGKSSNGLTESGYPLIYLMKREKEPNPSARAYLSHRSKAILDILQQYSELLGEDVNYTQILDNILDDHLTQYRQEILSIKETCFKSVQSRFRDITI